jgi:regulator of replication initiation timing
MPSTGFRRPGSRPPRRTPAWKINEAGEAFEAQRSASAEGQASQSAEKFDGLRRQVEDNLTRIQALQDDLGSREKAARELQEENRNLRDRLEAALESAADPAKVPEAENQDLQRKVNGLLEKEKFLRTELVKSRVRLAGLEKVLKKQR